MSDIRPSSRDRLLDAAREELVAQGGFLEIKAVAARARVSVGLAYHHFGSKAGLLAATVDAWFDSVDAAALDIDLEGESWVAQERERIRRYVDFHYAEPLSELMLGKLVTEPEVVTVQVSRMQRLIEKGTRNIARAQRRGEIPKTLTPDVTVSMLLGGIHQAIATALAAPKRPPAARLAAELGDLVVRAVRADAAGPEAAAVSDISKGKRRHG